MATGAILSNSLFSSDHKSEPVKDPSDSNLNCTTEVSYSARSVCPIVSGLPEGVVDENHRTPCASCRHSRAGFNDHSHICDISEVNELNTSDTLDSSSQDLNRSLSDPGGGQVGAVGPPKSPSVSSAHSHRFVLDFGGSSYLSKVVHEVLDTERVYVTDLRDIIQVWLIFCREE